MALYHTVVIRYITSITYGTLCHASGHLMIYRKCYGFGRPFYSQVFLSCIPSCFFQGFPEAGSSTSKLAGLHPDLRNTVPVRLFVWITTIHKSFLCARFYLRVTAAWPRNINLYRAFVIRKTLVLWKLYFWNICFIRDLNSLRDRWTCYTSLVITAKPQSLASCNKLFRSNSEQKTLVLSQNKFMFQKFFAVILSWW